MNIYKKQIERITIIGERDTLNKAIEYCEKHRYYIKDIHPKHIKKYTVDLNKYKLVGERTIKPEDD